MLSTYNFYFVVKFCQNVGNLCSLSNLLIAVFLADITVLKTKRTTCKKIYI